MSEKSFFLVIEGVDGSGKSTISRELKRSFPDNVKLTFEPHDPSCAGLFIRQILMEKLKKVPSHTLALAFAVNRSDHCDREIVPFLESTNNENKIVLCDRYILSSLVYQSNDTLTFSDIMHLNRYAKKPDLTIFLDAKNSTCYERMRNRKENKELFEKNLSSIREKYFEAIDFLNQQGENVQIVNAEGTLSEVINRILNTISANSPNWLKIQYQTMQDQQNGIFSKTEISFKSIVGKYSAKWDHIPIISAEQLIELIEEMEIYSKELLSNMDTNNQSTLFIEYLNYFGFEILGSIPWTDIDAFELKYHMPLDLTQRGIALLFGKNQRYDSVFSKLLSDPRLQTMKKMFDFLFVFDSNPADLIAKYYERELINNGKTELSPNLKVISLRELKDHLYKLLLQSFKDFYYNTLSANKTYKDIINKYCNI